MLRKSVLKIVVAVTLSAAALSPAPAKPNMTPKGACGNPTGRCIADCDSFNWCQIYVCGANRQSTPISFWRCYQPSGLYAAPHC